MKLIQVSKEFYKGKWQKVAFLKDNKGDIHIKPLERSKNVQKVLS